MNSFFFFSSELIVNRILIVSIVFNFIIIIIIIIIIISEGKVLRTSLRRWYRSLKKPPSPRTVDRTTGLYAP